MTTPTNSGPSRVAKVVSMLTNGIFILPTSSSTGSVSPKV